MGRGIPTCFQSRLDRFMASIPKVGGELDGMSATLFPIKLITHIFWGKKYNLHLFHPSSRNTIYLIFIQKDTKGNQTTKSRPHNNKGKYKKISLVMSSTNIFRQ